MTNKFLIILGLLFTGCGTTKLVAPNSVGVQGGFRRVSSSVEHARSQNTEISREAALARAKQQRIDNKNAVIEGYRKWKAQHP